jgi:DNA-directed RNA polymerase subunit H
MGLYVPLTHHKVIGVKLLCGQSRPAHFRYQIKSNGFSKMVKKKQLLIKKHILIPKHAKLSEKEKQELFQKYNISIKELPKINKSDPALQTLNVEVNDVIKVIRTSPTAGEIVYYRGVVNG